MISLNKRQPLYRRLYQHVLAEIDKGRLGPGDRVPSEKELSDKFAVSRITSKKALEMLAAEGKIVRVPGKGSFVPEGGASGGLRGGATVRSRNLMGCVVADFDDSFGTRLLHGIERKISDLGYQLLLHVSNDLRADEERAIGALLSAGIRGIIVMPCHGEHYNPAILKLVLDKFPLVFVDRYLPGLAASSVGTDNLAAAKLGTDHLIDLGHRRIAFVSSPPKNTSTIEERLEGFVRSHVEHGVATAREYRLEVLTKSRHSSWTMADAAEDVQKVRRYLAARPEVTAVLASEYSIARIVEEAARQMGKRIPEEISLVCFDQPMRYDLVSRLTHLRQREYEIGMKAAQLACDHASGRPEIEKIRVDADLILGSTTAKPRLYPDISS